jgi:hypothetical protein
MDAKSIQANELLRAARNSLQRQQNNTQQKSVENLELKQGQRVEGKVVNVTDKGVATVDLNGITIKVPTSGDVTAGQQVTLRVTSVSPQILFEILAQTSATNQAGANPALTAILQGQTVSPQLWQNLFQIIGNDSGTFAANLSTDLSQLMNQLQQLFQGLGGGLESGSKTAEAIRELITLFNQSLEGKLQSFTNNPEQLAQFFSDNRASLQGLLSSIGKTGVQLLQQLLGGSAEAGSSSEIINNTAGFINRTSSLLLPDDILRSIQNLTRSFTNRLADQGNMLPEQRNSLQNILSNLENSRNISDIMRTIHELRTVSSAEGEARQPASARFSNELATLLERAIMQFEQGKQVLMGNRLTQLISNSAAALERVEAFTRMNAINADRGMPLLIVFPFKFDNEVSEIRIRHDGKGKENRKSSDSLTMVMMLNLESLGQLRVDVLLKQKQLHCHIYVEKKDIAATVDRMLPLFKEQVSGRGLNLVRFACSTDSEKLNSAAMIVNTFSDDDGTSLVNVTI